MLYLGIDLGTSAVKILLVNETGNVVKSVSKEYPLMFPKPCWSEQNPQDWWDAVREGIRELVSQYNASKIKGIGVAGQMHGLVALDERDQVIRPAILWNDGRTDSETKWLNSIIGKERLSELTANIAFAGFTAPKLLWMKENEPDFFGRIAKIMLPKDYINYKLTGVLSTDHSDASGMLLLNVKDKCWSEEMLQICRLSKSQMPKLFESVEVTGRILPEEAKSLGLPEDICVVAGAGDNAAAAIGTGTCGNGKCNISLGTSGTVFISSDRLSVDPNNALHAFVHADGNYHLMGCMLSAASCNKWFCEEILKTERYKNEQDAIREERLGKNPVFFLPYLMGERSPINDVDARGTFTGLTLDTTREDMLLAVLEGVAFAIRDSFEVAKSLRIPVERSVLCGGGAKSALWRTILANVLQIPLDIPHIEEGPGYGAAMLAMVGCGEYPDITDCAAQLIKRKETVEPQKSLMIQYEARYRKFQQIYPAMKELFQHIK